MGSDDFKRDEEFTEDVPTVELNVATGGSAPSKSVPTQGGGGDSGTPGGNTPGGSASGSDGTQSPSD